VASTPFSVHEITATIHFVRGYRYLDVCGETLLKLLDELGDDWLTNDPTPQSGILRNPAESLTLQFNSSAMSVTQSNAINFDRFCEASTSAYEVIWQQLGLDTVHLPVFRVIFERPFEDVTAAQTYLDSFHLFQARQELRDVMAGEVTASNFSFCTERDSTINDLAVRCRQRIAMNIVKRTTTLSKIDSRLLRRSGQLPVRERKAVDSALKELKRSGDISPWAVQMDLERSFESDLPTRGFPARKFIEDAWAWMGQVLETLGAARNKA
jgi:hypothetical protein